MKRFKFLIFIPYRSVTLLLKGLIILYMVLQPVVAYLITLSSYQIRISNTLQCIVEMFVGRHQRESQFNGICVTGGMPLLCVEYIFLISFNVNCLLGAKCLLFKRK